MINKQKAYTVKTTEIFKELYPNAKTPDWFEDFIQAAYEHKTEDQQIRTFIKFLMEIENGGSNKEVAKVKINVLISMFTIT